MQQTTIPEWTMASEVELIYRTKVKASERPKVTVSSDAYRLFKAQWDMDKMELQEEFKVMFLNRADRVLGIYAMSVGNIHSTVVDARMIMAAALKANASSFIIAHNHPSGRHRPSEQDKQLTYKLKNGAAFLDLELRDHIILTSECYYSFADDACVL